MARHIRAAQLETRNARLRLPVVKKPIFVRIGPGLRLGYRRNATAGTWIVAIADGKGGNSEKAFGAADDYEEADGKTVLTYWQAQDCARAIAAEPGSEATEDNRGPPTIAGALAQYQADLKLRGGDAGNVGRVKKHLPEALTKKDLRLVTAGELRRWRDKLAASLAPATVNRTVTPLKAALNHTADHDERIPSRRAWEIGLASIRNAEEARNVVLDDPALRAVISQAWGQSPEFGLLVETAAETGQRIGQLARLSIQDLQHDRGAPRLLMPASRKGRGQKKIARYPVPISGALAAKLVTAAAGRATTAPLLVKPAGGPWRKSDHSRLFARAALAAGLDPSEVTIYSLRHSNIVRQLLANIPARIVAAGHDTSIIMLERNYSKYISDFSDALVRRTLFNASANHGSEVVVPLVVRKQG